jgi:hypothetical protein
MRETSFDILRLPISSKRVQAIPSSLQFTEVVPLKLECNCLALVLRARLEQGTPTINITVLQYFLNAFPGISMAIHNIVYFENEISLRQSFDPSKLMESPGALDTCRHKGIVAITE